MPEPLDGPFLAKPCTETAKKGAELRHTFANKQRLKSRKVVEARAGIEPACKDLQSSA